MTKSSMPFKAATPCLCDSGSSYQHCCQQWHEGRHYLLAPTAEALMRSRYSAFVLDKLNYLLQTWHPNTRPASLEPNPPGIKWLGLQVKRHSIQDDNHACVEFVARNRMAGRANRLHEASRFVREDGHWYYLDAQ